MKMKAVKLDEGRWMNDEYAETGRLHYEKNVYTTGDGRYFYYGENTEPIYVDKRYLHINKMCALEAIGALPRVKELDIQFA